MFVKKYGNLILGLLFMAAGIGYYFMAAVLPPSRVMDTGPSFVPKIIAGITFGVAAILTITSLQKLFRRPAKTEEAGEKSEYWRVLLTMAAFGAYVYAFEPIGFPVATCVYLFAQMCIMAPREKLNPLLFLAISVVTSGFVYYLFRYNLSVILPAGILG